jgi:hypothetical protein
MAEALGEHRTVLDRDDGDEQEREQTQDLADPTDRDATGESSLGAVGEVGNLRDLGALGDVYRCHSGRGCPPRANCGLRKRGQGLTYGHRILRTSGLPVFVDLNLA